jgi:N-acetylmuramoyl-L-alanine amidase
LVAAIDIGHSRASPGAKDVLGRDEAQYNLELATAIESRLARSGIGGVVVINRKLDMTSLAERPQKAFCLGADLFVSIHHDSVAPSRMKTVTEEGQQLRFNDSIEGYTVYYSSQNIHANLSQSLGLRMAEALLAQGVVAATPHQTVITDTLRKPVSAELNVFDFPKLKVSLSSPIPAVLLEAGFLSNRKDMQRLQSAGYRLRIADGVLQGLKALCAKHPETAGLIKAADRQARCGVD